MPLILLESVPPVLHPYRQGVFWRRELVKDKWTKVPYTAMGYHASVSNPDTWSYLDYLVEFLAKRPGFADGIGFVLTKGDPFCGLDLDDCLSDSGGLKPWAQGIVERFSDTWCYVTPSGAGLRAWCLAETRSLNKLLPDGRLEIYSSGRYFTLTGDRWNHTPLAIVDHQADIDELVSYYGAASSSSCRSAPLGESGQPRPIADRIPVGQRYAAFCSIAGTLRKRNVCLEAIGAAIRQMNRCQADPPKPDTEVEADIAKILRSAAGWG